MLTRIYTEDKNREAVIEIVAHHFDGATFFSGVGMYKGAVEKSLVIEVAHGGDKALALEEMIEEIRVFNGQESMLVAAFPCNVGLSFSKGGFTEIGETTAVKDLLLAD